MADAGYRSTLLLEVTDENLPVSLGGQFKLYNEPYEFDMSHGGPFMVNDVIAAENEADESSQKEPVAVAEKKGLVQEDIIVTLVTEAPLIEPDELDGTRMDGHDSNHGEVVPP
jgi:hypothetical protein